MSSRYPNLGPMFLARVQFESIKEGGSGFRGVLPNNDRQVVKGNGVLNPNSNLILYVNYQIEMTRVDGALIAKGMKQVRQNNASDSNEYIV